MKPLLLLALCLTLLSCATAPSRSPMTPVAVADPVAFLNGRSVIREGTCSVTNGGRTMNLPCVVYAGDRNGIACYVAIRSAKGILMWISAVYRDGSQQVLWEREPQPRALRAGTVLA